MRKHPFSRGRGDSLAGILLAMLLFRAYIPAGFMPASGAPFLLELCPAASALQMPAHHRHHPDSHTHFDNCPFGAVPAVGPISHLVDLELTGHIGAHIAPAFEPLRLGVRALRAHQPRGPPSLA
jgi:hypothetical protein